MCPWISEWQLWNIQQLINLWSNSRDHCTCTKSFFPLLYVTMPLSGWWHQTTLWIPAPNTTCLVFSRISIILSVCARGFRQSEKFERGSRSKENACNCSVCVAVPSFPSTAADIYLHISRKCCHPDSWRGSDETSIPLDFCEMLCPPVSAHLVKFQWFYCPEFEPTYHYFPKIIANASFSISRICLVQQIHRQPKHPAL
jgi:hypothetical protein